jgi:hypothetical protein
MSLGEDRDLYGYFSFPSRPVAFSFIKRFIAQLRIYGMYSFNERLILDYVSGKGIRNGFEIRTTKR